MLAHVSIAMPFYAVPALSIQIQGELVIGPGQFGLLISAWAAGGLLTSALAGPLNRRLSPRKLATGALVSSALLLGVALGRAASLEAAMAILFLAGLAYSVVTPATSSALAATLPPRLWGRGVGIKQTGVPLGGALGASAAAILEPALGWQQALVLVSLAALVIGAIAWASLPDSTLLGNRAHSVEARSHPRLLCAYASCLVLAAAGAAITAYFASFLAIEIGIPASSAGALLGSALFAGAVGRIAWGALGDILGTPRRGLVLLGPVVLGAVALASLAGLGPHGGLLTLSLLTGATTIGWAGVQGALILDLAGPKSAATATGINAAVAYLGVFSGPLLVAFAVGQLDSLRAAWALMSLALLLSAPLVLIAARPSPWRVTVW